MNTASDPFEEKTYLIKALQVIRRGIGIIGGDQIDKSIDLVAEFLGLQLDLLEAVNTNLTRIIKADFKVGLSNLQDASYLKGKNRINSLEEAIQNFKFATQKDEPYEIILALFFEGTCHQLLNRGKIALQLYKKAYQSAYDLRDQLISRLKEDPLPLRVLNSKKKDQEMQLQHLKFLVPALEVLAQSGWNRRRIKKAIQLQKKLLYSYGKIPGAALIQKGN